MKLPNFKVRILFFQIDQNKRKNDETFGMSRSSFASFHLTGIKASSGKLMQSSVDRLFENDGEVFMSNTFNEFQVIISFHFLIVKVIFF